MHCPLESLIESVQNVHLPFPLHSVQVFGGVFTASHFRMGILVFLFAFVDARRVLHSPSAIVALEVARPCRAVFAALVADAGVLVSHAVFPIHDASLRFSASPRVSAFCSSASALASSQVL